MWDGSVVSIHIAPAAEAEMVAVAHVHAEAGRGLEGDRYYLGTGTYSNRPTTTREVTLIEEEALAALRDVHHLQLTPGITRRNIVTRGAPLNHLIGKEFRVGAARLRGVRLCEPCQHLVDISGMQALLPTLIHRGGLHAVIVASGTIEVGDAVMAVD